MLKKSIVISFIVLLSSNAWSFSDCIRPVGNIWTSLNSETIVWISFKDGGSPIYVSESLVTEGQMSRFVAFALNAQATEKNLIIRYPEDDLTCPPMGNPRNDMEGFWVQGNGT